jgi:hypothetical protein
MPQHPDRSELIGSPQVDDHPARPLVQVQRPSFGERSSARRMIFPRRPSSLVGGHEPFAPGLEDIRSATHPGWPARQRIPGRFVAVHAAKPGLGVAHWSWFAVRERAERWIDSTSPPDPIVGLVCGPASIAGVPGQSQSAAPRRVAPDRAALPPPSPAVPFQ